MTEGNEFKSRGIGPNPLSTDGAPPAQTCVVYVRGRRYEPPPTNGKGTVGGYGRKPKLAEKMTLEQWSDIVDMLRYGGSGNGP